MTAGLKTLSDMEGELTENSKEIVSKVKEFQETYSDAKSRGANRYELEQLVNEKWDSYIIQHVIDAAAKREQGKQLIERGREEFTKDKYRNPALNLAKQNEINARIDAMDTHDLEQRVSAYVDHGEIMTKYELDRISARLRDADPVTYKTLKDTMKERKADNEWLYFNATAKEGLEMIMDNETAANGQAKVVFTDGTEQAFDFDSLIEW